MRKESEKGLLAIIPARGGSKGLPGKNIRPFLGLPLIAHSILFARQCPEVTRCIVSTDSQEIVDVAKQYGGVVPFIRPSELAQDDTPMWPVIRHALKEMEEHDERSYDKVLLLDPTSPARESTDVTEALQNLEKRSQADGIMSVSQPPFNPIWHCVFEADGWSNDLIKEGSQYDRRQDVPPVYRINGALYIWRAQFVRKTSKTWRQNGRHLIYEIPESRAMSIDTDFEFQSAELLVRSGLIHFPWIDAGAVNLCQP